MAKGKPSDSTVFRPTRHALFARAVRGLPGLHGPQVSSPAPRSEGEAGWGRMTIYAAVKSSGAVSLREATLSETRFGGKTSKNNWRRVERNPG